MNGLTTKTLAQACRIFLHLAYPEGTVPPSKCVFLDLKGDQPLEPLLQPPICQKLANPEGGERGYAFRLGSSWFPHVKLQVVECGQNSCVFGVDTHDALVLDPEHPDACQWNRLKEANCQLKEQVETAWEAVGLKTFNGLLKDDLAGFSLGGK